jgi:hypothetical protein
MYAWFTAFIWICFGPACLGGNDYHIIQPLDRAECASYRTMFDNTKELRRAQDMGTFTYRVECLRETGDKIPEFTHETQNEQGKWSSYNVTDHLVKLQRMADESGTKKTRR